MEKKLIPVTSPLLPDYDLLINSIKDIYNRKWLTNNGYYHQLLEEKLSKYLGVEYISLFTNGTLPLITALQDMHITGEVITTPYSFVATSHSIWWNGLTPVFVDVDPIYGNLDPNKIESAITPKTSAIMPVHVYGNPCDVDAINTIAKKYGLKVIYDAAHAFGVKINGKSVLSYGDISTLSFHATKVYNTVEGGALICHSADEKNRIDHLKNFGFTDEVTVEAPGINSKMDEIRSVWGVLNLEKVESAINRRKNVANMYRNALRNIDGIRVIEDIPNVEHNYAYFPIFIDSSKYGISRDELYNKLKANNIYARRYFYPLISDFPIYKGLPSAGREKLKNATLLSDSVICLPIYADITDSDVKKVIDTIIKVKK